MSDQMDVETSVKSSFSVIQDMASIWVLSSKDYLNIKKLTQIFWDEVFNIKNKQKDFGASYKNWCFVLAVT